ncbi:MAG: MATE family efflux transporter [Elusimicrobia bacterium]|nr:MATE family efflux transporter [Elusimicrobiota bacterium]
MQGFLSFRSELRPVLSLAAPIALMQTGMVFYGTATTLMVGRIGPQAIAGVGLGSSLYFMVFVCAAGILLGIDPLSSRAFGAGRPAECSRVLSHAGLLALGAGLPVFMVVSCAGAVFRAIGVEPGVAAVAVDFLRALRWHVFPALLFTACRQYLQSMGITRTQLAAVILGNALNLALGWTLIFGRFGAPALGVRGAGWALVSANFLMLCMLVLRVRREVARSGFRWRGFDPELFATLLRIGAPAGVQLALEVGAFSAGTLLMGRIGATATAAHQIALNLASLTFMVPLGISHAASVLVGQGIGRGKPTSSARAGWAALAMGCCFMALMSAVFLSAPAALARLYTRDAAVVELCVSLLAAAAAFQVFDGVQAVMTGALRGMGETRIPMAANLFGHWMLGLPVGALLAFGLGVGALGIWIGFCLGLAAVAASLLLVWRVRSRDLGRRDPGQWPRSLGPHPEEAFDLAGGELRP